MKKFIITLFSLLVFFFTNAQSAEDTTDGRFHDGLLNNLVGKWDAEATVHNEKFTLKFEAEWVLDHQYLRMHFKSNEAVPWLKMKFEQESFFGYNGMYKRYIVHEMSVHGGNGPYEGFCYAYKTGNKFKIVQKMGDLDQWSVQELTWEPGSKSWLVVSRPVVDGKEGEPFIAMKLVAAKPSTK
jgi:hypothetical protein